MKKIITIIAAVIAMSFFTTATMPVYEAAAEDVDCTSHFLGLRAWYDGLVDSNCVVQNPTDDEETKTFTWTIILNVTSMILGITGYLAIALVIWGGIQYMIAQGDPNKIAKGKKTITNAVIGLIITMSASIISGTIANIVSGAPTDRAGFFQELFGKVFVWSGIIAVIMMVFGGIQYVTSTGNPQAAAKAKMTILYSAIGLLVVVFAAAIVNVVVSGV